MTNDHILSVLGKNCQKKNCMTWNTKLTISLRSENWYEQPIWRNFLQSHSHMPPLSLPHTPQGGAPPPTEVGFGLSLSDQWLIGQNQSFHVRLSWEKSNFMEIFYLKKFHQGSDTRWCTKGKITNAFFRLRCSNNWHHYENITNSFNHFSLTVASCSPTSDAQRKIQSQRENNHRASRARENGRQKHKERATCFISKGKKQRHIHTTKKSGRSS